MTCNDWNSTLNRNPKHGHKLEFLILWHEAEKKTTFHEKLALARSAFNQFSQKGFWLSARKTGTGMVEQMIQPRGRVRQNRTAFRVRWWFLWLRWNELQLHQDHALRCLQFEAFDFDESWCVQAGALFRCLDKAGWRWATATCREGCS